ncbi:hypothetical protein PVNG_06607 [Plasmodium vivax North Korean]|uniref:VIR protein n=1 Tax=Plasmodium vivax North Korean TaxID=1035514 RepID=A0A0J9W6G9_PLAVI|nr:hypothetical protein PVNG_06607 [Plasmodium vivax North Korean]
MRKVSSMLHKNYSRIGSYEQKFRAPSCKYLNFWLDSQKENYVTNTLAISADAWEHIENLWDTLKGNYTYQCERKMNNKSLSETKKFMDFMIFCINKEELKKKCEQSYEQQRYKNIYCTEFNNYINKNYKYFLENVVCLEDKNNDSDCTFIFSDDCTLQDMSKTFPEYNFTARSIVDGKSRNTIKKCQNTKIIRDVDPSLDNNPAPLDDDQARLSVAPDDSIQFDLPSPTVVHSIDNGTSKTIYYSGLSLSGVFFTSMVLYKYTTLGPLIRSLVSKKEKFRQTTNKHLAEQWLQRTSEYMDSNSENSHYNFPYQSMQN